MCSGGTIPESAETAISRGAAETTAKENRQPVMPCCRNSISAAIPWRRCTASGLDEVLAPHAAKLGIVADEISELCALLHEVARGEARDFLLEGADAEQLGQHLPRIIEAQGLVEVRRDQVMPQW